MTFYLETGDEDFGLLKYLYNQLKGETLQPKRTDRIIEQSRERNLDQTVIETAIDIGSCTLKVLAGNGCRCTDKKDRKVCCDIFGKESTSKTVLKVLLLS